MWIGCSGSNGRGLGVVGSVEAWVGMLLAGSSSFLGRWFVADGAESVGGMPALKE